MGTTAPSSGEVVEFVVAGIAATVMRSASTFMVSLDVTFTSFILSEYPDELRSIGTIVTENHTGYYRPKR